MFFEPKQEQVDFYQENGFVIIEDFLNREELETWRTTIDDAVAIGKSWQSENSRKPQDSGHPGDEIYEEGTEDYYSRIFTQKTNLWMHHEGVRDLMFDSHLGNLASKLAGVDRLRIWHDQALYKEPWANPTAWHLDCPYWSFHSRNAITIWVALDDATIQNGCVYFLLSTHKMTNFDRENASFGDNIGELFQIWPEWTDIEPVANTMKAGSCSFHNGLTAHSAGANMTLRRRRAMTCNYMPDGSTFNGQANILPDDYLASLKIGDVLNNDQLNPLL